MKLVVINGSPRKHANTAQLCEMAVKGAESLGASGEVLNLYDAPFRGCISCFGCHLNTSAERYDCFYKDALTPILEKSLEADALIIGSPVYYGNVTGAVRSYMERLLFPLDTYHFDEHGNREVKRRKAVPTAFIYTMNATEEQLTHYKMDQTLKSNEGVMHGIFGVKCEHLYSCDTMQWEDYSRYYNNMFDPQHKKEHHDSQFPIDLQNAYELGARLISAAQAIQ